MTLSTDKILADFKAGRTSALARVVSIVENRRPESDEILAALHQKVGHARRIGITGPPGAGKSTITTLVARRYREAGLSVGIVCVDPTSPFTGGALLGDRVRMEQVALDDNVFIRSMATRGSLGGLAATTREIADVFDAFGFDRVIIETVGVGQSELDIARTADTTVVVLVPESGDSIQTLKAGVMEAADIFVVNKSDRPGADRLRTDVGLMLGMRRTQTWTPPVLRAVAAKDEGIDELVKSLDRHFDYLEKSGALVERRRQRLVERVIDAVDRRMRNRLWEGGGGEANGWIRSRIPDLEAGVTTPYSVADELLAAHGHLVTRVDN